jgi:hypothetical protein
MREVQDAVGALRLHGRPTMRLKRPKTKRKRCAHCLRVRLRKYIEWHPGIDEWQCSDFGSCDVAIAALDEMKRCVLRGNL